MWPLMINGYVAMTTSVSLQFKMKAMTNDVTAKPMLSRRIEERSTTTVRNKVASLSKRDASMELVLFVSSNHPISFLKIAATKYNRKFKRKENKKKRDYLQNLGKERERNGR